MNFDIESSMLTFEIDGRYASYKSRLPRTGNQARQPHRSPVRWGKDDFGATLTLCGTYICHIVSEGLAYFGWATNIMQFIPLFLSRDLLLQPQLMHIQGSVLDSN